MNPRKMPVQKSNKKVISYQNLSQNPSQAPNGKFLKKRFQKSNFVIFPPESP